MTNEEILKNSWHWVVEDKLGFNFASMMMAQDGAISHDEINSYEIKIKMVFKDYFIDRFGIELFGKCPNCSGLIVLKEGIYGEFMACNQYPNCKTIFNDKYKNKKSK